jgi:hypothetical protein
MSHQTTRRKHMPEEAEWHKTITAFLGQQVEVLLAATDNVVAKGQLLGFGDGGDVEILQDDGLVHHCWPMLEMRLRA